MTPSLRVGLLAACIATAVPALAQKSPGNDPSDPPCGRAQATWTQAQKDEYAALMDWMQARAQQKDGKSMQEGKAAEARAEKKLRDAWRREETEGTRSVQPDKFCGPKR